MHELAKLCMRARCIGLKLHDKLAINWIHASIMQFQPRECKNSAYLRDPAPDFARTVHGTMVYSVGKISLVWGA